MDDILLFTRASTQCCRRLKDILAKFCACSGQIISNHKSKMFFSSNVHRCDKESLSALFEISPTSQLGMYLVTPIFTSKGTIHAYQFIVDRIRHKIEVWQSKFLSMAGRVTLIRSSSNAIPIFSMQTTLLHRQICQDIDKLNRRFLWGDSGQHRACHTISWDTIDMFGYRLFC